MKKKKRRLPKFKPFKKFKFKKIKRRKLKKSIKERLKNIFIVLVILFLIGKINQVWTMQKQQHAFEQADQNTFIELIGKTARKEAAAHDLYASVMIAQAILESDWGQSQLTRDANNLFGIKGSYLGQSYQIATQEDNGKGELYTITADFRKYPTYHASLSDNADLLAHGIDGAPEFYAGAWKSRTQNYQEATAFLQGRYATDTQYASKLNALIVQYNLTRFDK